ncbi:hypothetical protein NMG60_11036461 [Bertholletia excelsa]
MKIDGECLIELIWMPQLHTSLHFHLTPIIMINGSSYCDLLLNVQNFCRSIPTRAKNPLLSRLALILGRAYYLDTFSSYLFCAWLPDVYRGHNNQYIRGASFPIFSY